MRLDVATAQSQNRSAAAGWNYTEAMLAARSDASVLLTGPAETAREFAYQLHLASGSRYGPFAVIDCRKGDDALGTRLLEAVSDEPDIPGVLQIRLVQAGTVFLQEINRLAPGLQRTLADRLTQRAGAHSRSRRRLIASSSEPLFERVRRGTFDDRLYYRLNTIHFFLSAAPS